MSGDEMFMWRNFQWRNIRVTKCPVTNCPGDQMVGKNCPVTDCPVTNCPCDEMSVWRNVQWRIVRWRNVLVTKCPGVVHFWANLENSFCMISYALQNLIEIKTERQGRRSEMKLACYLDYRPCCEKLRGRVKGYQFIQHTIATECGVNQPQLQLAHISFDFPKISRKRILN